MKDCKYYNKGLNYIVWEYNEQLQGIFVIHIGGSDKKVLYSIGNTLLDTEFKDYNIYFCTQDKAYWRNHSKLVGYFEDGSEIYKYIRR